MQQELSLHELFFAIKKRWKAIVAFTILGALVAFVLSAYVLPKKYTSSLDMYVNNSNKVVESGNRNQNDLNAAQMLANTYIVILKNPEVLRQVASNMGNITASDLNQALSLRVADETEVLRISAETENPQLSADICNALAAVAPEVLQRVVKAGSVEVIGAATPATAPSSPNVKRNTLLGALLLLVLSTGVTVLAFVMDNTVKGEEDIKQRLGLPVLGEIPSFTARAKEGRGRAR